MTANAARDLHIFSPRVSVAGGAVEVTRDRPTILLPLKSGRVPAPLFDEPSDLGTHELHEISVRYPHRLHMIASIEVNVFVFL
jgi:hypothetical protein